MRQTTAGEKRMPSELVHDQLRGAILEGEFAPGEALKPQVLAARYGASVAMVREVLTTLAGEGVADRLPNRGFAVPTFGDRRWQEIIEARRTVEPAILRLSVARGDLEWETRVRAASHRLARTAMYSTAEATSYSGAWGRAHHLFHRTLLEGCGNAALLETFDRLWVASELARRLSVHPDRRTSESDVVEQHRRLEEAAVSRDPDAAAAQLVAHLGLTAAVLTDGSPLPRDADRMPTT
ncbi:GntR family transcriptional regulator [Streptomyces sp. NPDC093094]|uniref:GntR family transcriptional regulator n=1 Tax=Streptomyces sp. NPDC093094 TaxID=3366026 RepID=UPI0037F510CC